MIVCLCVYDKPMLIWNCLTNFPLGTYAARLLTGAAVVFREGIISLRRTLQIRYFGSLCMLSARLLSLSARSHVFFLFLFHFFFVYSFPSPQCSCLFSYTPPPDLSTET